MYLVKSCFKRDNIWKRKTIKIGTLTEYRDTEQQQIADREEGMINLSFDLNHFHMPIPLLNNLNTISHGLSSFHLKEIKLRPNPLLTNHVYAEKYSATTSLIKFNRFIFCISKLDKPDTCKNIFKEYNDYWYLPEDRTQLFGDALSLLILEEVSNRVQRGEQIFSTDSVTDPLEIRWYCNNIFYTPRQVLIDNTKLYKESSNILYWLSEGHMVKPDSFQHEKEMRFIFDIYSNGELLQPLNKPLFVSAEKILPLIKK